MYLKTKAEIDRIREVSHILSLLHGELAKHVYPGVNTLKLNEVAENFIKKHKVISSIKGYEGYPAVICTSVNTQIVHAPPSDYALQKGDILTIDCAINYQGYHSDSAYTHPVGTISKEAQQLLNATRTALQRGIQAAHTQNRLGDIGHAIQSYIEPLGYGIVRELVGHGIGQEMHESPNIPNYGRKGAGKRIQNGMVFTIEPMITMGKRWIEEDETGAISTQDKQLAAHFEHTLAIINGRAETLTTFEYIPQNQ